MAKKKDKKELPIIALNKGEREEVWDDLLIKEEGIVLEFNPGSNTGKIKSLEDDGIYEIDSRGLTRTKIELQKGDKVLFAPFEDPEGNDYARVIRIVEAKA
jgi:hypothetical protein